MKPGAKILCPFHPDHDPSLFVDEDGGAHCFACGWNGTIVDVMAARGYTGPDLLFKQDEFLKSEGWRYDGISRSGALVRPIDDWEVASINLPIENDLVHQRWDFLLMRGYRMETLAAFKTRTWKGVVYGWPANGDKWVTRWRSDWFNKTYLYDTGFSRASLYALDERTFAYEQAIVVEGVLDAAKVWQAGHYNVVATLGGPTISQCRQLRGFKAVYEMFDNDDGGDAHRRIMAREGVQSIRVPYQGGDPGELGDEAIQTAIRRVQS